MTGRAILLVDDYRSIREVLGRALTRLGYTVFLAASGEEACEILKGHPIDVVLMDMRMPAMSGQTLFHVIISQWPELRSRVVIMTGDPEAADHETWLKLYDLPVVTKPFNLKEICDVIDVLSAEAPREVNGEP